MNTDVFISLRGQDSRKSFVSFIRRAFAQQGITWFNDEEEEKKEKKDRGWKISPTILNAIAESRVALVVFSKNYASSPWCLNELVKIMDFARKKSTEVMPIFYEVAVSDVRHQKGRFYKDFERHDRSENPETVKGWRDALNEVTKYPGFSSHASEDDSKLIREITRHVSGLLSKSRLHKELKTFSSRLVSSSEQLMATKPEISNSLVAMDRHMEKINTLLKLQSSSEIRVIGITGVSGIGKTSIARFISQKLSPTFQDHCFTETLRSFLGTQGTSVASSLYQKLTPGFKTLGNSRDQNQHSSSASSSASWKELLSPRGLKRKASQMSSDLSFYDKSTSFWHQRVLVIVDNVETSKQLDEIMKDVNRLGSGSRVILTTEDKSMLLAGGVENVYEVECLRYDEALELLSVCAFKKQYPPAGFEQLSVRAVQLTGCLPLGLKLLGSFLCGRTKEDWECELERLEAKQDKAIAELSELLKPTTQGRSKKDWECEVRMLETKHNKAVVELLKPIPQRMPHNQE